ncbi:probable disease resistance protein At1g12290 [Gossypium hirsutum]|uniref:Probable disease resistance protein At1g12290 n=1 Tax=Gossypium hirsutum TaxID=3635 RepID=A0ABM3BWH4_GOSHI|nr:probable disease resistance protein At1g12290 [Gossypium hirsutum]
MITEAEKLVANGPQQMNNLCLGGFASKNCLSSYKFGKKVAKMLQAINDLISKGVFDKVAESQPAASVVVRPEERPIALQPTIEKERFKIRSVEKLGFQLNPGRISVEEKAVDIYWVLRIKRFVVLLDDLWERVDLNQVGIPKPSQDNGSKLIFTTRYLELCGEMEAREKIKVECLEPKDAWKLFQDKVGDETLNSHPNIRKLAKQVVEGCGGLPVALITIGRAMACKTTPGDWKYAIEMLKRCSLPKMENEGWRRFVKMHDVIRDMVLWIVCELEAKENKFFVKAGAQLFEEPDIKIWECAKRMSVMKNNIEVIIETPKCPNLHSLFLSENKLKVINYGFFQFMPHLTVLNLSNSSALQVLPRGISQLISLECLDLSHTAIRELAIELKSLTKLKMLDLSCIPYLRRIPRNLISSFSRLQIFRITSLTSEDYPEEDNVLNGGNENLIEELKSICPELKKLPLNSDSAKGNRITIDGNEDWWAEIEWENEATRQTFSPFFRSYS